MTTTYSPRVRVTIELSAYRNELIDVSDDLLTVTTNKAFGRAAGGWQITLPYRQQTDFTDLRYDDLVQPDDLVTIDMDAGDGKGMERSWWGW